MPPDLGLGEEQVSPDEAAVIAHIDRLIRAQVERDYPPGARPVRRDQHPKAHGCVRAEFTVGDDVPEQPQTRPLRGETLLSGLDPLFVRIDTDGP